MIQHYLILKHFGYLSSGKTIPKIYQFLFVFLQRWNVFPHLIACSALWLGNCLYWSKMIDSLDSYNAPFVFLRTKRLLPDLLALLLQNHIPTFWNWFFCQYFYIPTLDGFSFLCLFCWVSCSSLLTYFARLERVVTLLSLSLAWVLFHIFLYPMMLCIPSFALENFWPCVHAQGKFYI